MSNISLSFFTPLQSSTPKKQLKRKKSSNRIKPKNINFDKKSRKESDKTADTIIQVNPTTSHDSNEKVVTETTLMTDMNKLRRKTSFTFPQTQTKNKLTKVTFNGVLDSLRRSIRRNHSKDDSNEHKDKNFNSSMSATSSKNKEIPTSNKSPISEINKFQWSVDDSYKIVKKKKKHFFRKTPKPQALVYKLNSETPPDIKSNHQKALTSTENKKRKRREATTCIKSPNKCCQMKTVSTQTEDLESSTSSNCSFNQSETSFYHDTNCSLLVNCSEDSDLTEVTQEEDQEDDPPRKRLRMEEHRSPEQAVRLFLDSISHQFSIPSSQISFGSLDACCGSGVRDLEELESCSDDDTNFVVIEDLEDPSEAHRCQREDEPRDDDKIPDSKTSTPKPVDVRVVLPTNKTPSYRASILSFKNF